MVEKGNRVKVHYTGKFDNGEIFDSSLQREPLEFTVGFNEVIKGFDDAVLSMKVGDKKTVTCEPNEAYGERNENFVFEIPHDELPDDFVPRLGMPLELANDRGETLIASIIDINDNGITLDANHPLAGKRITFEIELIEIL